MKYLDYLTKEELIDALTANVPEEKLYDLVLTSLERNAFHLLKKHEATDEEYTELFYAELRNSKKSARLQELTEFRDKTWADWKDYSEKGKEVRFMKVHRLYHIDDNRSYEEIKREEDERRRKEVEKIMREHREELERKYG